nr:helix-turn-helix transcriptional regulator [Bifidobacterium catenulatum]
MSLELPTRKTTKVIKSLIKLRNVKQRDVAEGVGISEQQLCNKLHGRNNYTYRDIVRLADYFDVSVDSLLGRAPLEVA